MPTSSFTEQLIAQAREIQADDFIFPTEPISEGDDVLGEMNHFHCQLFTLWQHLAREAETALVVVRHPRNPREREEACKRWKDAGLEANIAGEMFWFEIARFFGCEDKSLTVRSGGEIVTHFRFSSISITYIPLSMRDEDADDL